MRALAFRELRRRTTSCTSILALGSHQPPSIGNRRCASVRNRWHTRFSAAVVVTLASEEAATRTWAILVGLAATLISVASELSRGRDRNRGARATISRDKRKSRWSPRCCDLPVVSAFKPTRRRSLPSRHFRETMTPDFCDRMLPANYRRSSSGEENRARGISGRPLLIFNRGTNS